MAAGAFPITIFARVALALVGTARFAEATEIRVYCTGAPAPAAKAIAAQYSARTGEHFMFTVAQPARLEHRLAEGGRADVLVLPAPVIAQLTRSGMVRTGSAIALARVGIGVVVPQGAAAPDISTAAAIRKLLLDAHSIVYPDPEAGGGYAGRAIARMIDGMDVAAVVKPKLTLRSAIGGGVELVARGKVEVGLFNISEIIPIKGVTLVGPLPAELQSYIVFSAAITANSSTPKPDLAFIRMLAGPLARNAWQKAGLELMPEGPAEAQ